ncbi:hypothetical protein BegalDRAFT_0526 [Beggiatoa alba B18LD]|uniref:Uncharacterized protein n=1 Tax=Beggiatoa alba B18LD TaxID=395493 RepID=I3CCV1_9GAMM|nr:hypothetical protein [Beggiatoa alba]EIJ41444.1 hypothetical protein BegalDRAFT_0526 [Beggiatoa alba B18LD]
MMTIKRILYLSDYELIAYQLKPQSLSELGRFNLSDATIQASIEHAFIDYLITDPKTPIHFFVDSTQEEYKSDTIPHVMGRDKKLLLQRRRERFFEKALYTYTMIQGRESTGRRDDFALFTALNNETLLQPWLDLINTHKIPLAGIYSLPLLSQCLLKYLPRANHILISGYTSRISSNIAAGLRQSFFSNNTFKFSRLIPLHAVTPEEQAQTLVNQMLRTHQYLQSVKLLPFDTPLLVLLLCPTALVDLVEQLLNREDLSELDVYVTDIHDFAERTGLSVNTTEPLYLHHLVLYQLHSQPLRNHYAQQQETRDFFYRSLARRIYQATALIFAGAIGISLYYLQQSLDIQAEISQTTGQLVKFQQEIRQLHASKAQLPLDILQIQNVIQIGHYLHGQHVPSLRPLLTHISQIWSRYPEFKLAKLEWRVSTRHDDFFVPALTDYEISPTATQDSRALSKMKTTPSVAEPLIEGVRLYGRIRINNQRELAINLLKLNELINSFTDKRKAIEWEVNLLNKPNADTLGRDTTFTIQIDLKHPDYSPVVDENKNDINK